MINKVIDTEQGRIEIEIIENEEGKSLRITFEEHPGDFKNINIDMDDFNELLTEYGYNILETE